MWQKRPIIWQKKPIIWQKRPFISTQTREAEVLGETKLSSSSSSLVFKSYGRGLGAPTEGMVMYRSRRATKGKGGAVAVGLGVVQEAGGA